MVWYSSRLFCWGVGVGVGVRVRQSPGQTRSRDQVCMVEAALGRPLKTDPRNSSVTLTRPQALQFLHGMKLIHTDLKPENILLCNNDLTDYQDAPGQPYRKIPASYEVKGEGPG